MVSSVPEVLTTRLEPRTGLVRVGRPGLGNRRRGWISCRGSGGQRVIYSVSKWPSLSLHILSCLCATHMAEEFIGQTQVIVKRQESDSLQPHHDNLQERGQDQERGVVRRVSSQRQQPPEVWLLRGDKQ